MSLPGFSADASLSPRAPGIYNGRLSRRLDNTAGVAPQLTYYHMCCPSGDCDGTWCTQGDGAHVDCDPKTGKANCSCNSCFLTTACVEARGLGDDCEELTILREFRDTYLMPRPGGRKLIEEYYRVAPAICAAIASHADAAGIYEALYTELVQPTIQFIRSGQPEIAVAHYATTTRAFRAKLITESN